jgi:hypothetical protein
MIPPRCSTRVSLVTAVDSALRRNLSRTLHERTIINQKNFIVQEQAISVFQTFMISVYQLCVISIVKARFHIER